MKEQIQKPKEASRTIQREARAINQTGWQQILQMYALKTVQRESLPDEDELIQGKFEPNRTGLPHNLKTDTQETDIHVAPGQEKCLPHEAWHVVQQKQGRVQPTVQLQGVNVNDDAGPEKEADVMGEMIQQKHENVKLTIQRKILKPNTATGCISTVGEFQPYTDIQLNTEKQRNFVSFLISSDKIYTVSEVITKLDSRHFKLGAPSGDPQGNDQYFKITELGFPRLPGRIKTCEQPSTSSEVIGAKVAGTQVLKNSLYTDTSKSKIDLEDGKTYLWVQKPDGRIIIGDEKEGLGHPTLGLDLADTKSTVGRAGMARIGGELKKTGDVLTVDNHSGRYGGERVKRNLQPVKEILEKKFPGLKVKTEFR